MLMTKIMMLMILTMILEKFSSSSSSVRAVLPSTCSIVILIVLTFNISMKYVIAGHVDHGKICQAADAAECVK